MKIAKKAAVVLCAGLMLISPGVVSQQAFGEFPAVLTVKAAAMTHDISQGDITITDSGEYIITGTTTTHKIIIEGGNPTVTVRDVNITLSDGCPLTVHSGNFTLIIEGTNTFQSGNYCPGIDVAGENKITIKESQSAKGTLNAIGGKYGAGIGGGYGSNGGTVIVNGGTVIAIGGSLAAGIGGGSYGDGGSCTINGGTVTATGGNQAAGIGGGSEGNGGDFTINAGNVTATKGFNNAEDIGHGSWSVTSGTATYNGGTVNGVTYTRYTVEIPATVNLSQEKDTTCKISVRDVFIGQGKSVNVKLTGASPSPNNTTFHVKSNNNVIDYTIKSNNNQVKLGDTLLSVASGGSGEAELTFSAPSDITYAGKYTGTLTFTISVS